MKRSLAKTQKKLWELCKKITRKKFPNVCYTCGKGGLEGSNWHTGHMWPKASLGANLKYDLRILRPQCYHCNINLGGNGAVFYRRMLDQIGKKEMNRLEKERSLTIKAEDHYLKLIDEYTKLLSSL